MTQRPRRIAVSPLIRITALVCVICLLVNGMAFFDTPSSNRSVVTAATSDELKELKQQYLDEQAALEAERDKYAADLNAKEQEIAAIEALIASKEREIADYMKLAEDLHALIADKETAINAKNDAINAKIQEIADKESTMQEEHKNLKIRLRELAKTSTLISSMQLLISGNEFTDYLIKQKMSEQIAESTQQLMDQMEAEVQELNAEKAILEKDRAAFEAEKAAYEVECAPYNEAIATLETAKQELDKQYSELQNAKNELHQNVEKYNEDIAAAESAAAEVEAQIQAALEAERADITPSYGGGGSMGWPAKQCNYISSTFKYRWGRWHNGIDICGSGCYGTQINAAADGVVIYADWMSGYGKCVMVDHGTNANGDNIVTLYAHACELNVYKGQYVNKGDILSYIGTTGNVTGPHLHFEVRVNGSPVDPIGSGFISTNGVIINESL